VTGSPVGDLVLRRVSVVDPAAATLTPRCRIRITAGRITEITTDDDIPAGEGELDGEGLVAVPGLIDCHVHVTATNAALGTLPDESPAYVTAQAGRILEGMLRRGFTTVRDVGGADFGLAAAVEEGLLAGPRIFFGGKALTQSGGHGDLRPRGRDVADHHYAVPGLGRVCDGVDEVRRAARDEIRRGAHHLKIMISGGCASPTDRIDSLQFSDEEIAAIVQEARAAGVYCAGHAYTAKAVNRGLALGIRSIEHGNLLDETSVALFDRHAAFYVPTLVTYIAQLDGTTPDNVEPWQRDKISSVVDSGFHALELADRAGVRIAFGTDLLGSMHARQSEEFALRTRVQKPDAVLRSATTVAAALLRREGELGVLTPGAYGDVVLARANPLDDIAALADPAHGIAHVVQAGIRRS